MVGDGEDSIVARPCVIAEFDFWPAGEHSIVVLEYFNQNGIERGSIRAASITTRVQDTLIFAVPDKFAEFNAKDQIVVCFI